MVCSRVIENNGEPLFALYYCRANSRFVIMAQFSRGRTSRTTRPTPGSSSEDFWEFRNTFFSFPSWICWITGFQHLPGDIHECLTTRMTELCRCLWYFSWLSFRDHVFCISSHGDLEVRPVATLEINELSGVSLQMIGFRRKPWLDFVERVFRVSSYGDLDRRLFIQTCWE